MDGTGTFARRVARRHAAEMGLYEERLVSTTFPSAPVAELEGDTAQSQPTREEVCLQTAHNAFSHLEDVTAQTRMHLIGTTDTTAAEKAARKRQRSRRLEESTTKTRTLVVSLLSTRGSPVEDDQHPRRRLSRFIEHGLSPGSRRIDDHSREESVQPTIIEPATSTPRTLSFALRAPSLRIPKLRTSRKTVSVQPGTSTLDVQGTKSDLVESPKIPQTQSRAVVIPPRTTSKNFSLPLPQTDGPSERVDTPNALTAIVKHTGKAGLMSLPTKVRNKIYGILIICSHEVFICVCCPCASSAHKQPAITRVNRKLRAEALPIYYGENRFMIRGEYDWHLKAPMWLRALSQHTRDLIRHVEISTRDLSSAICMMATLGFALSHRLPFETKVGLLREVQNGTMWMTFSAIGRKIQAYELLPEIERAAPLSIWDTQHLRNSIHMQEIEEDRESIATIDSVSTTVLNPDRYDGVISQGIEARRVRGRCVTLVDDDVIERGLMGIAQAHRRLSQQEGTLTEPEGAVEEPKGAVTERKGTVVKQKGTVVEQVPTVVVEQEGTLEEHDD